MCLRYACTYGARRVPSSNRAARITANRDILVYQENCIFNILHSKSEKTHTIIYRRALLNQFIPIARVDRLLEGKLRGSATQGYRFD